LDLYVLPRDVTGAARFIIKAPPAA
jgi:hypothetical protein